MKKKFLSIILLISLLSLNGCIISTAASSSSNINHACRENITVNPRNENVVLKSSERTEEDGIIKITYIYEVTE